MPRPGDLPKASQLMEGRAQPPTPSLPHNCSAWSLDRPTGQKGEGFGSIFIDAETHVSESKSRGSGAQLVEVLPSLLPIHSTGSRFLGCTRG